MSFLTPLFLAGLAVIAVPVLIHLTQRSKSQVTQFPSVMFLDRVPFRTNQRRRIRHPLLLALRILAITLLAAGFARPFIAGLAGSNAAEGEAREVVLLIDRSLSMGYGDRWERALAAARETVGELTAQDRTSLIFFADRAEAVTRSSGDHLVLQRGLDGVQPGSGITRFDPALRLAGRILDESELPNREIVLISDFQRVGWPTASSVELPERTLLRPVDLSEPEPSNLAVTDLTFRREATTGQTRVTATARVSNMGPAPAAAVEVSLVVGERAIATRAVDLGPHASASVSFPGLALPDSPGRGEVQLASEADRLHADNSLSSDQLLKVLIVEPGGGRDRGLFLREALSIGDQPPMEVRTRRPNSLSADELRDQSLVILNDAVFPAGAAGRALRSWVEAGGGLIVVAGSRSDPSAWNEGADLLPGTGGGLIDRTGDAGAVLSYLDFDHPTFELFREPRSGDFSQARFLRYRDFRPNAEAAVLARFDDGRIALVEGRYGSGVVAVWTSTLDRFWNDLALQPVFLPFAQRLARHVAGYQEARRWYRVGQVIDLVELAFGDSDTRGASGALREAAGPQVAEWVLTAPSGDRQLVELADQPLLIGIDEAGFYELRPRDGGGSALSFAANPELEESDLSPLDPAELAAATLAMLEGQEDSAPEKVAVDAGVAGVEEADTRSELWWFLMLGAGILLAAETFLSNRLSRSRRPGRTGARATTRPA
jgi:hypothetical protein